MKKLLLLLSIIFPLSMHSQKVDGFCSDYGFFGENIKTIKITIYDESDKIIEKYDDFSKVKNSTPQDLLKPDRSEILTQR